jgi:hypothetical protein
MPNAEGAPAELTAPSESAWSDTPSKPADIKAAKAKEATRPRYFDGTLHARVQKMHNRGIWVDLGPKWGGLRIRLRTAMARAVVVRRESAEASERIKHGLTEDEPLPAEANIEVNRASMLMAITAADGAINISTTGLNPDDPDRGEIAAAFEAMRAAQAKWGAAAHSKLEQDGDLELLVFDGQRRRDKDRKGDDREGEGTREIFAPFLAISFPLLTALVRNSRGLQKKRDEELGALGEDYVLGQQDKEGWAD